MKNQVVVSRKLLGARQEALRPVSRFERPVRGWVKAIREALGMTSVQLGRRLGVSQPSVSALESPELNETISLATLRRAAEALDCQLVYALVPRVSLEAMVRDRVRARLNRQTDQVSHSMLLEDQAVAVPDIEAKIDEILRSVNPRLLWDD